MVRLDLKQINKEMQLFDKRRDIMLQKCHEAIRFSKRVIYAIHRGDSKAGVLAKQLREKIQQLRTRGELQFSPTYKVAMQEFVEAIVFYEYVYNKKVPSQKDLYVSAPDYLSGLCDLTGELMRKANYFSINKKPKEALRMKDFVDKIYEQLLQIDIRDNDLRKKFDQVKYNLQKLEDLALNIQRRQSFTQTKSRPQSKSK
jgi:translin